MQVYQNISNAIDEIFSEFSPSTPKTRSPLNSPPPIRIFKRTRSIFCESKEESKDTLPSHIINDHIEMMIELKKSCTICYNEYKGNQIIFLKCWHHLCTECYSNIDKCHICREKI